ncbi:MAG: 2,3-bisphosphoglycerate-independent phosphoglycerate mutase, partial [Oscillospiraceae bacterium]|nr:2,3-bisphosphoglycerate-independent phosphoglycerate mutase [Oscillospiraceae bacterium]
EKAEKVNFGLGEHISGDTENEEHKSTVPILKKGAALHCMGLLSDGGVHSHISHLYAILETAKTAGVTEVYVHCFMDGRDVSPTSGVDFISELTEKMEQIGIGKIATVSGRYYAMDRDNRWERVETAYNAMVKGVGNFNPDPIDVMRKSYSGGVTDEFIVPSVCDKNGMIKPNDSIIFFNFRPDRAREITRVFTDPNFNGFTRTYFPVNFVCMTKYAKDIENVTVAFPEIELDNTFGEYIANANLTQLRIAETEKYAHVTFFFNGGVEEPYKNEDRVLIPSPKVATYDLQPEMSAYLVCDEVCKRILSEQYDIIVLNYANCDMVGHTGIFDAAVKAVETVDECVGKTVDAVLSVGGIAVITADHGNADKILNTDGTPFTAHTTNPVPFIVVGKDVSLRENGCLCDIAPTMLELFDLPKPPQMSGESLLV